MQITELVISNPVKRKILLIEDDEDIAKVLSYRLIKSDFYVFVAADGEKGLAEARREGPDLVILDLGLPKLSGTEVCRAIREDHDKKFSRTPIIMLTAKAQDVDRVIGKVLGANSYMIKPFNAEALLNEINKFL